MSLWLRLVGAPVLFGLGADYAINRGDKLISLHLRVWLRVSRTDLYPVRLQRSSCSMSLSTVSVLKLYQANQNMR